MLPHSATIEQELRRKSESLQASEAEKTSILIEG